MNEGGGPWGIAGDAPAPIASATGGRGGTDWYVDDGYGFMEVVEARGFRTETRFGEWPFNVFSFKTLSDGRVARLAYQEGTTHLELYANRAEATAGVPRSPS